MMSSLIPSNMLTGVFLGILHRGYRICSGVEDFMAYAMDVAYTLRGNGCPLPKLRRAFNSFVSEHVRKYRGSRGASLVKSFCRRLQGLSTP